MIARSKFPGWRTMTASQRYNARAAALFDGVRRRDADALKRGAYDELSALTPRPAGGRSDLPGQLELPDTAPRPVDQAKRMAAAPLTPTTAQKPCDIGLFSDTPKQVDLEDLL